MKCAVQPFEINIFDPLITYLSPFFSALVLIMVTSLPASGSVMAKPIIASPAGIGGRYFFFLFFGPKGLNHLGPKTEGAEALAAAGINAPELLGDEAMFEESKTCTSIFFFNKTTDKAVGCCTLPYGRIKFFLLVKFFCAVS